MKVPAQIPAAKQETGAMPASGLAAEAPAFADARAAAATQRKLASLTGHCPIQAAHAAQDTHPGTGHLPAQLQPAERPAPVNDTGLPDDLKAGIEGLSGVSMDGVSVHYNSSRPATLQALAYAQGSEIHLAPGQERHLPHEAWHVVQQRQGRVAPTLEAAGVAINDDHALEQEADIMGGQAMQRKAAASPYVSWTRSYARSYGLTTTGIIQGVFDLETITADIVKHATSIHSAGGTTAEAYIITTAGEHRQIFVKFTSGSFAVEAAALAREFNISTPAAIEIPKDLILAKVTELDEETGRILNAKPHAIAFEYLPGSNVNYRSKEKFTDDSYRQVGAIAAFDMLIGKTDLFENYESYNPEQENYNNVRVQGANLAAIDLSASAFTQERLDIIQQMIAEPAKVHRYVTRKIGGLFELDDKIRLLQIQQSILSTMGSVTAQMALAVTNSLVRDSMTRFADIAPEARAAADVTGQAIEHEKQELLQRREEARVREATARRQADSNRVGQEAATTGGCYLTTACCAHYGFPDDCEYLTVLRAFRDTWLLGQPNGAGVVQVYYQRAPTLVAAIGRRLDQDEIYALILQGIRIAVDHIKRG